METINYLDDFPSRIDSWLSAELDRSRAFIQARCKDGNILVNDKKIKPSHQLHEGDIITYSLIEPVLDLQATDIPLDIIYEDDDLIVINKQTGLTVHPGAGNTTQTLVNALLHYGKTLSDSGGLDRPGIVHRLDKDTAGLMVVAKHNKAHEVLAKAFKERTVKKKYIALISGYLQQKEGVIDLPIAHMTNNYKKMEVNHSCGKASQTEYKVVKELNEKTLVDITLHTGRTHQIRVHFSHLGHPVVGDPLYGSIGKGKKQLLLAYLLEFTHPITKKEMSFSAPTPKWALY